MKYADSHLSLWKIESDKWKLISTYVCAHIYMKVLSERITDVSVTDGFIKKLKTNRWKENV